MSYVVFIDESGDHNLHIKKLDTYYNTFVLWWVIFEQEAYTHFDQVFKKMKIDFFGNDNFVIHTNEITRPSNSKQAENERFNDPKFRNIFYHKINSLIESLDARIVYNIVNKNKLVDLRGSKAEDPYLLCFESLLNKILMYCPGSQVHIYPEKRWHVENIKLETEFLKLKTTGTEFYTWSDIAQSIQRFDLVDKYENDSGLQLADLIVTPIGRNFIGKRARVWHEVSFDIIASKVPSWGYNIYP